MLLSKKEHQKRQILEKPASFERMWRRKPVTRQLVIERPNQLPRQLTLIHYPAAPETAMTTFHLTSRM